MLSVFVVQRVVRAIVSAQLPPGDVLTFMKTAATSVLFHSVVLSRSLSLSLSLSLAWAARAIVEPRFLSVRSVR
jgi:hypothetical protein